jgi:beta-glucosidase
VAGALGDRVRHWITLNEPFVVAEQGHLVGVHAPGIRNIYATGQAIHNQLRAHVAGSRVLKSMFPESRVGIALHNAGVAPFSDADVEAAARANAWHNYPLFLDPLFFGRYPKALESRLAAYLPKDYENDMDDLRDTPDFVGMNYYSSYLAREDASSWLGFAKAAEPDAPRTSMDWIVRPDGLRALLNDAHQRYGLASLYVTENGAAYEDLVVDGRLEDTQRLEYLKSHVAATLAARDDGVPVDGYFVWSLFDNFEWAQGFSKRFGIVHVDFETQERLVKESGHWYGQLARSGTFSVA